MNGLRFSDSSCSLKRKRPPKIEIPTVLQEIQAHKLEDATPRTDSVSFSRNDFADHVGVFSVKGKKRFMEDTHKIIPRMKGHLNNAFFGVYDGHGGRKAAKFVAENLHNNILEVVGNCAGSAEKEDAIKAAFLKTDRDFLNLGLGSGVCCVTALIQGEEVIISNLGDCRAVLSRGGVAEAVTKDHRVEQEDERKRIENKGGYVEIHRGAWRVHGVLSVSRSIGDAHLKDWMLAEPDSKVLLLSEDMEFLVLATDGLWEKVGNQEIIDVVTRSQLMDRSFGLSQGSLRSISHTNCSANLSPSKVRRVSLVTQPKMGVGQSPIREKPMEGCGEGEYNYAWEIESPGSKSRRISLVRHKKIKLDFSPKENNDCYRKIPTSSRLVAACKELVDLALSRGSLDDITVMIIDLKYFRCKTMHDSIGIPACFSFGERPSNDPGSVIRSGQSVFMSVYQTKIVGQCRLITITWCKNLLLHGLSICVQGPEGNEQYQCKVEMKPWYFWRKQGSKHFEVDGRAVDVVWDLKSAKFNGETEPQSDYYVAVVCEEEVVLLIGDLKKDAFRKTGCRPALIEPTLVSKKEHVFGKKMFSTRIQFHEKGKLHTISIEFINVNTNPSFSDSFDPELEIRIDGQPVIKIKHLHWKFRGNESVLISRTRLEVYWDVHDWLFGSGPRYGLFIFRPISSWSESPSSSLPSTSPTPTPSSLTSTTGMSIREVISTSGEVEHAAGSSNFCLFLYAWKIE
ncbi:uncharacterized protein LOC120075223 [Benincasa hispida]|uniref:uncharacterized protein LOC120075223 n=1 Tax=Benincasa hispida TaxID=102211 RepID=UPI0018FFCA21|nr:uncharacterized protein LOC120075223 [Benincasa hispida]